MTPLINRILILVFIFSSPPVFAAAKNTAEVQGIPEMTAEQRQARGIVTSKVGYHRLTEEIIAPAEVTINAYRSSQVATRIRSQIIKRHARMGDMVKSGQKLLTLSSVSMADAQSQLLIADREWQRVKKLGRTVVSGRRYIAAQVDRQQAYAKVLAYGMTRSQINALLKQGDASRASGMFDLVSFQKGTVISDKFVLGQVVDSRQVLMEISDESRLWVETQINPKDVVNIKTGAWARIDIGNNTWLKGRVVQIHRRIDETTRTLPVRIEVNNERGLLRPGQFVKVALQTARGKDVISIPESAVTLLHGEPVVFVLKGNKFSPQLVETGEVRGDWIEIKNGLQAGNEIVSKKIFLLKSLLLKSQIGDTD